MTDPIEIMAAAICVARDGDEWDALVTDYDRELATAALAALRETLEEGALAADFLSPFILPEPEPDPLVELMAFNGLDEALAEQRATNLRKDAADLGYKIIVERIEQ